MSRPRLLFPSLLTFGLVLVSIPAVSAQTADEKALAAYRLNMATVRKVAVATQAFAAEQAKNPNAKPIPTPPAPPGPAPIPVAKNPKPQGSMYERHPEVYRCNYKHDMVLKENMRQK